MDEVEGKVRKIIFLFLIIGIILVSGCATEITDIPGLNISESKENISEIKSETIIEDKISEELKEKIEKTNLEVMHVIIQFDHNPTPEEKEELANIGIQLHSYKRNKSWTASVPVNKINDIAKITNVKKIKDIPTESKLMDRVRTGEFAEWVINEDGSVRLIVAFYNDVSQEKAKDILDRYNVSVKYRGHGMGYGPGASNDYEVTINKTVINDLADEDVVKFITEVSPSDTVTK